MTVSGSVHAIVLAGGKASRMGGVDKPALVVGGRRMLDTALDAVADCECTVVVGPYRDDLPQHIVQVQESPSGAGPVAAVAAGFAALDSNPEDVIVVIASDLPFVCAETVRTLAERGSGGAAFAVDADDHVQFLFSAWSSSVLGAQLNALDSHANQPMKFLVPEHYARVPVTDGIDCDTRSDLEEARAASRRRSSPVSIDGARQAVLDGLTPLTPARLPLADAYGAALAEPLTAAEACPRQDVSAMDGYAVSGTGPWHLREEIRYAGGADALELDAGEAVRIATGAHLPRGASTVIRDEHALVEDGLLQRAQDAPVRDDARRRGEDWHPGHTLAPAGSRVGPAVVSAAASAEVTTALVRGPVRAHVVVTGDEIRRDGPLQDGQTRDSLSPILPALLSHCGVHSTSSAHLRDTPEGFDEVLSAITDTDVIVIVGATGGGAADNLRLALDRAGARVLVGRVAVRPGGSQVTATMPDGRVVLGLPGNPYAAVATLLAVLPTIVSALVGASPRAAVMGTVVNADEVRGDVTRILPATRLPDGYWRVDTSVRTAHLAGLVDRDALAVVRPEADNAPTELIPISD